MRFLAAAILVFAAVAVPADPGRFSVTGLEGWEPQTFDGRTPTRYQAVPGPGGTVLEARCDASASGWIWKEPIDLRRTPRLRWRWRVDGTYAGLPERDKDGDDFPARVYVVRDGGWRVWRTRSLVYVWTSREPAGSHWPSAYTDQAHVIAVRSGPDATGRWHTETRDVRADFRTYFGLEIDAADGVAVMTDCDDHGGRTTAAYGDLEWLPRSGEP